MSHLAPKPLLSIRANLIEVFLGAVVAVMYVLIFNTHSFHMVSYSELLKELKFIILIFREAHRHYSFESHRG